MIDALMALFGTLIIRIILLLPTSTFDLDGYVEDLHDLLPQYNYFVPFYLFKEIFGDWLLGLTILLGVYLIINLVKNIHSDNVWSNLFKMIKGVS